jgi:hypothetical protein
VAVFDSLHDMGDPIGAATHVRQSLTDVLAFPGSLALLGCTGGESRIRDVLTKAGFTRFRSATETTFNPTLDERLRSR